MDKRREYEIHLELLTRIVAVRGGDSSTLPDEYPWPEAAPRSAVSLGPILTGGNPAPADVVPVPPGLSPSKS